MPNFTRQWYEAQLAKQAAKAGGLSQGPEPEPIVRNESLAAPEREAGYSSQVHVRITSYRTRLIDPDNLCPKYFIDCLKYAEIIPDDRPQDITLEVKQVKVKKGEERTEIELS